MKKHTCENLKPKFEERNSVLITEKKGFLTPKVDYIEFSCKTCSKEHSLQLAEIVRRINKNFEHLCLWCEKENNPDNPGLQRRGTKKVCTKVKKPDLTYSSMKKELKEEHSHTLHTSIQQFRKKSSNGKTPTKMRVDTECDLCHYRKKRTFERFRALDFSCPGCNNMTKSTKMYSDLKELMVKREWKIITTLPEFLLDDRNDDCHCEIIAIDSLGNLVSTTQNRFTQGHGSQHEANFNKSLKDGEVIEEFARKGYLCLLSDNFPLIGKGSPYKYPYYCGCMEEDKNGDIVQKISYITVSNLRKNKKGCKECAIAARKTSQEEAETYMKENMCIPDFEKTNYKTELTPIFYICMCGRQGCTSLKSFKKGVRCDWCTARKREHTNMLLYGATNPFGSKEIQDQIRETYSKIFPGATHNSHIPQVIEKRKETNMTRYEVSCYLLLPEIKKLSDEALILATGTKYPLEKAEYREKGMKTTKERYGEFFYILTQSFKNHMIKKYGRIDFINSPIFQEEMMTKYGSKFFLHSEAFKSIMIDRWGAEHAMQNDELFKKMLKSSFKRDKTFIFPSGKVVQMMGYECFALSDLLKRNRRN